MKEKKSMFDNYSKDQLQKIIDESNSIREVVLKVGLCGNGMGSYQTFYRKVKVLDLNIADLKARTKIKLGELLRDRSLNRKTPDINLILVKNSNFSRVHLKEKLLKMGILENKCSICNQLPFWNGKSLTLQLDHINGTNNDNRIENLRILCQHCHSQQPTTGSRKLKLEKNKHLKIKEYKEKINKIGFDKQKENIEKVNKSNIDFSKFGWVKKVSLLISKKHQKVNKWIKKYLPEIYAIAYKKGEAKNIVKKYKYPKLSNDIRESINKLILEGKSIRDISKILNIGRNRIRRVINHTVIV